MFRALQWRAPHKRTSHQGRVHPHGTATCTKRNFATRSAHTLQAIIPHDTANHPAHHRHAAFTPACFALPRHANTLSTKAAQVRKALRHHGRNCATRSAHTLEVIIYHRIPPIIPLTSDTPGLHQHVSALPSGTAPSQTHFPPIQGRANPHGPATSRT